MVSKPSRQALARGAQPLATAQATIITIKVKPGSRVSLLAQADNGAWLAQLKSPPVDGKANEELLELVARYFRCRRSAVSIKSGASGRTKRVRIESEIPVRQDVA